MKLVKQSDERINSLLLQIPPDLLNHHTLHRREILTHEPLPLPRIHSNPSIITTIEPAKPLGQLVGDHNSPDFREVAEVRDVEEDV